jgi:hypothetical protein
MRIAWRQSNHLQILNVSRHKNFAIPSLCRIKMLMTDNSWRT